MIDKSLMLLCIVSTFTTIFLIILPFFVEISILIHLMLILCSTSNAFITGRSFAELRYQWTREKTQQRHNRLLWYKQMCLNESFQLIDPKFAEDYWIKI